MKLLMISAAYPPHASGEGYYVKALTEDLVARHHQVEIWTSQPNGSPPDPRFAVYPRGRRWNWRDLPPLLNHIRRTKPDGILLHYTDWMYPHPMVTLLPTLIKAMGLRTRFLTVLQNPIRRAHAAPFIRVGGLRGRLNRWRRIFRHGTLLHHSDSVIVLAEFHHQALRELLPAVEPRCKTLPVFSFLSLATSADDFRTKNGIDESLFLIAFYGFIYPGKDMETLLRGFQIFHRSQPNSHLLIIGDSPDGKSLWRETAKELGLEGKLTALGAHSSLESEPSLALQAADVCVLPFEQGVCTRRSSFAAAAIHGLPILTTLGPESDANFVDGENILAFQGGNPDDLAEKLLQVHQDRKMRARLATGSKNISDQVFSRNRISRFYERLLEPEVSQ